MSFLIIQKDLWLFVIILYIRAFPFILKDQRARGLSQNINNMASKESVQHSGYLKSVEIKI